MQTKLPHIYLYRRIVQAKLFIDGSFNKEINLDNIAEEAYFSKFHFTRLFKKVYGKTPHQYLTGVRIDNAKKFLQTGMPVYEVCYEVGFDSISSFTGLFKRITSSTPSDYQKYVLKRKTEIAAHPLRFVPNCFAEQNGWIENSNIQEVY